MCPSDDQLVLLAGQLHEDALGEIEAHLDACEACRRIVGLVSSTRDRGGTPSGAGSPERARAVGRGASIGRYLVVSLLGEGGMGRVYAAYHPELDRRVALKILRTARGSEPARGRLVREGRALGKLSHPNVVQVYDVGEHDGDVFVAMDLVEGQSLGEWCASAPAPGWRAVLAAYVDAARGLTAAHATGMVHRDVKPSNILSGNDGRVRVADFGLAALREADGREAPPGSPAPAVGSGERASADPSSPGGPEGGAPTVAETVPARREGSTETGETRSGAVLGTPLYMAPEQHDGLRATAASDQYGLCAALYQGLYGAPPFAPPRGTTAGTALAELLAMKRSGAPAAPPGSPVPAWIQRALARGLAPIRRIVSRR
jgi:serine/threonine protein kinase